MLFVSSCGDSSEESSKMRDNSSLDNNFDLTSPQQTLFTIMRTNFKEDHILHYDLRFDEANCEISNDSPIDGYYLKNGSRIDFNDRNKEYYAPNVLPENRSQNHLEYDFPILTGLDSLEPENRRILVDIERLNDTCSTTASLIYEGEAYRINRIVIALKLIFGMPRGTKWAKLETINKGGEVASICLLGKCK